MTISLTQVEQSRVRTEWSLANDSLYELCQKYPLHKTAEEIVAKVLMVGRTYAAAIERRKTKDGEIGDDFYRDIVVPTFRESGIDEWIRQFSEENSDQIALTIKTHGLLTKLIFGITEMNKRSLASKYLHFHLPEHFFIYDSRAKVALNKVISVSRNFRSELNDIIDGDPEYIRFVRKILYLRGEVQKEYNIKLSPRELDRILINMANDLAR